MSLWHIAWAYLWNRKLTTVLTIFSVALSVGLISSVLSLRQQLEQRFAEEGQAFDLVVGPKGSPLSLVLGSVYFMDNAIGRTPLHVYEDLKKDSEVVEAAFPIGLGDTFEVFRIVGTVPELMDHVWIGFSGKERRPFTLAEGEVFSANGEAVVGAVVARQLGLELGDTFESVHGSFAISEELREFDHADHPYTVVGILEPSGSPFDRAIYCSIESIWEAHGHGHHDDEAPHENAAHHEDDGHGHGAANEAHHEDDGHGHGASEAVHHDDDAHGEAAEAEELDWSNSISAVLVQLHSPVQRFEYEGWINENTDAMAVVPIDVIQNFFDDFLDPIKGLMMGVGYLVVVISAISILIGLYLSIMQRKRDLAIMRALGASSYEIFGAVLIEAFWVTTLGIAVGWVFGNVVTWVLGMKLATEYGLVVTPFGSSAEELRAFATVALVGLVAGLLPAWQAYRSDVAHDLADRQ